MSGIADKINFIIELEKLKGILRKTRPLGLDRYENSAEHSWQTTLSALVFLDDAEEELDALKVLKMLLIHDVVEIDAGDVFVFDQKARADIEEKEQAAAKRIFGLLPTPLGEEFLAIWQEFEARETAESKFAKAMDRINPVLQNLNSGGQSWVENGVKREQVLAVNSQIEGASPELWRLLRARIESAPFFDDEQ